MKVPQEPCKWPFPLNIAAILGSNGDAEECFAIAAQNGYDTEWERSNTKSIEAPAVFTALLP